MSSTELIFLENCSSTISNLMQSMLCYLFSVKLGDYDQALDSFNKSLDLAKSLNDEAAENAITKAIADVKSKGKSGKLKIHFLFE